MSSERLHNMKAVELRTGLSAHLIRVWERRYAAVTPARSGSRHRLYSEAEIERLDLLRRLSHSGLAISQIAKISTEQLRTLLLRDQSRAGFPSASVPDALPDDLILKAIAAIKAYDCTALEATLDLGMVTYGYSGVLEKILVPLLYRIGQEWQAGHLTAGQEHAATAAMKDYLARNVRAISPSATAPRLIVTTPAGQIHEMGAALAAGLARKAGWNVTYLGASLPAEEIACAAIRNQASAVALSIIYPADDPDLPAQLCRLRRLLPEAIPIIAGGQSLHGYLDSIKEIGAIPLATLADFTRSLDEIRSRRPEPPVVAAPEKP